MPNTSGHHNLMGGPGGGHNGNDPQVSGNKQMLMPSQLHDQHNALKFQMAGGQGNNGNNNNQASGSNGGNNGNAAGQ